MEAVKKIPPCACGTSTELICDGCGKPVCHACHIKEICSFDPKNIRVKIYCKACSRDLRKNPWGELYWKDLTTLFV
jgi:hypothetical protein